MGTLTDETLAGILEGPRARGAFLLRSVLNPPWALRIEDRAPLSLATLISGEAWITYDDGEPARIRPGEIAIMRGPDPYTVADSPTTPPDIVIHPGQVCTTTQGENLWDAMSFGVRSWGDGPEGSTVMLTGTYQMHSAIGRRLLGALPALLVRPAGEGDRGLISLLGEEMSRSDPGQELVLDRILDLLLVRVLRSWLASPGAGAPAWYRAQHDPVVGPALRMLHSDPARPWTLPDLAAEIGVSRAGLARRFTSMVGEPPMSYLTGWRLALAADLLCEPEMTIGAVARQVGYGSSFALSAAFKRVRGLSPQEHRRTAATRPRPFTGDTADEA
ncbi:AraC family transcriptional regulator [Microtetraspora sp. NBRC 13810]|uniref:AraC family transcriptional regulator n=1 Tax=Microtetraspora sp. NBRC 13810 TaxID=3030990 RepID=UPI0024A00A68|nr:AraC family transcriptional regulator [Microtetraspora sp. NBRC 13810]GLW09196.1 AraC family transcriptional regulator [Microtetraspora sp. NBRC 13810]